MIRFITEEYLRDLYRKEPFSVFKLSDGQRLTPGARQYLTDKGIKMDNGTVNSTKQMSNVNNVDSKEEKEVCREEKTKIDNSAFKICAKLKSLESLFLMTAKDIFDEDFITAQGIVNLKRKVSNVRSFIEGKASLGEIECKPCTGMSKDNFYDEIGDCFEVTEFHMQLKNSSQILKMDSLRCNLRELQLSIMDLYENDEKTKEKVVRNINAIINSLSQMICTSIGGTRCQRKK